MAGIDDIQRRRVSNVPRQSSHKTQRAVDGIAQGVNELESHLEERLRPGVAWLRQVESTAVLVAATTSFVAWGGFTLDDVWANVAWSNGVLTVLVPGLYMFHSAFTLERDNNSNRECFGSPFINDREQLALGWVHYPPLSLEFNVAVSGGPIRLAKDDKLDYRFKLASASGTGMSLYRASINLIKVAP